MTQPSNPLTMSVSGSETEEFTYTPGSQPFYLLLRGKFYIMFSWVVWLDRPEDAMKLLQDVLEFQSRCLARYESEYEGAAKRRDRLAAFLNGELSGMRLEVTPLQMGRMLKVSWATNDTDV